MMLDPLSSPLRLSGDPADDRPFTLAGRRARVGGGEARGCDAARIHDHLLLRRLRLAGGTATEVAVTPGAIERLLEVDERGVTERILVPSELPGVLASWTLSPGRSASGPCFDPLDVELSWELPGPPTAWIRQGGELRVSEKGTTVCFRVHGPPAAWEIEEGDDALRVRLFARIPTGESLSLSLAAGADAARALDALAEPAALVAARAGALRRAAAERLEVAAPAPHLGTAVAWARARLDGFLVEARDDGGRIVVAGYAPGAAAHADAVAGAWVGLGALAGGDFPLARATLQWLAAVVAEEGTAEAEPLFVLLAARYLAWTGEAGPLERVWQRLQTVVARRGETDPLAGQARAELAVAAESLGKGRPTGRVTAPDALAGAGGWTDFAEGRAGAGWQRLQEALAPGFGGAHGAHSGDGERLAATSGVMGATAALVGVPGAAAPAGERGAWPGAAGPSDAAATARFLCGVMHGLLGVEADAPRGRLRLRPQLPAAWERTEFRRLRMGDALVTLRYTREGALHRFEVEQESGAVPVRAILEPALPAPLAAARVDGTPATLYPRPFGERVLAPVQLVLDAPRVVELETEGEA